MTRDEAQRILRSRERGVLSITDKNQVLEEIAFTILEAALRSSDGRINIQVFTDQPTGKDYRPVLPPKMPLIAGPK